MAAGKTSGSAVKTGGSLRLVTTIASEAVSDAPSESVTSDLPGCCASLDPGYIGRITSGAVEATLVLEDPITGSPTGGHRANDGNDRNHKGEHDRDVAQIAFALPLFC